MGERSSYDDGLFCWADLSTTDLDGARTFYTELLGWEWDDDSRFSRARVNGKLVGAAYPHDGQPAWMNYVSTGDAAGTAARAEQAGASIVVAPREVPEAGHMAILRDPQGAAFALWQAGAQVGSELVNEPGTLTWNQLSTSDIDAAEEFYAGVFEWEFAPANPEPRYDTIQAGKTRNGSVASVQPGQPPNWMPFFVARGNAYAAAEKVAEVGGAVVVEPMKIPAGTFLVGRDPQGAFFALFEGEVDP